MASDKMEKAVSYTQDWSDPKRALEDIERASAARDELASNNSWFDKLVKPPASSDAAPTPSKRTSRKAPTGRRVARKG